MVKEKCKKNEDEMERRRIVRREKYKRIKSDPEKYAVERELTKKGDLLKNEKREESKKYQPNVFKGVKSTKKALERKFEAIPGEESTRTEDTRSNHFLSARSSHKNK
ncbi:unnamed protein product [Parnassius apollo]|uniref:(apollo) hypothetical protein n=1 Tax=Parnassius apollo TaxID=110799 RepID=A0A8S3WU60_PARAO|nr:unnamed protein product [Parnassius apollo]